MTTDFPLRAMRVLISGAGVAGPALACWLARYGAATTVVEVAPTLRGGGFGVDFRGPTHLGVLDRMGVLDTLRGIQTHAGAMRTVDEHGREIFTLPVAFAGGDIEVYRDDLSRVLYERSLALGGEQPPEYLFGDTITSLAETADGVRVGFARTEPRTYDLVIGADGLHSTVRRLAFGPEPQFVRHLGYYLAGWSLPNDLGVDGTPQQYNVPGRMAGVNADLRDPALARAFVVFASPELDYDRGDVEQQKKFIAAAFGGMRWHVPRLLESLQPASELYFDAICRVSAPHMTAGRVALLGDAAFGVTLGGMGVGTGIVGAYVLAGELASSGGDHRSAFEAYERRMRGYASGWQKRASPGKFLAPATATGLRLRNTLLANRLVQRTMISGTKSMATGFDLPDYAARWS